MLTDAHPVRTVQMCKEMLQEGSEGTCRVDPKQCTHSIVYVCKLFISVCLMHLQAVVSANKPDCEKRPCLYLVG